MPVINPNKEKIVKFDRRFKKSIGPTANKIKTENDPDACFKVIFSEPTSN